jgi:putative lysine transport system substrate-binding protein
MRKMLVVLLASVMTLVGCGSGSSTASITSTESTSVVTETTEETSTRRTFRVGMECAYAPNNWQESESSDTNLPIENLPGFYAEGYDVQIARKIGEYLDADIVIVKMAFDGLIEALNQGQIDLIIAGMADTEERKQSILFSNTYNVHNTEYCLVVQKDGAYANATSLEDFAGASVLGQKGTRYDTVIDQIENVNHLPAVDSVANMLSRLEAGTADAIVLGTDTAESYLEAYPSFSIVRFEEGKGFDIGFQGSCVGIRLGEEDLRDEINAALDSIDTDTRQELLDTAKANMPK